MTRRVMEAFGAVCVPEGDRGWRIAASGYQGRGYEIEPDASAASYFLAAAAITGGSVRVDGLSRRSMQGDVGFADALGRMGCKVAWNDGPDDSITVTGRASRGIDIDMNAISDTVPTLAVVALFADGPTTIRNVAHIRDKETDRISDLACELRRLGGTIVEQADGLTIIPAGNDGSRAAGQGAASLHGATVKTYDDHRMAMSLALVGLRVPDVFVADPACVGKTFPDYWDRLSAITRRPDPSPGPT
jgi:3-phosphoshikimate 1-carboxyvinyltransferase